MENNLFCGGCNKSKDIKFFCIRKDGRKRQCKECENNYRLNNKDRINDYVKKRKIDNKEKSLLYAARNRAKEKNIPINIELSDIKIPNICPVLGIEILIGGDKNNSPSLDRIIPEKGYIKGNIQIISWRANWLKNNATPEEIEKLYLHSIKKMEM